MTAFKAAGDPLTPNLLFQITVPSFFIYTNKTRLEAYPKELVLPLKRKFPLFNKVISVNLSSWSPVNKTFQINFPSPENLAIMASLSLLPARLDFPAKSISPLGSIFVTKGSRLCPVAV